MPPLTSISDAVLAPFISDNPYHSNAYWACAWRFCIAVGMDPTVQIKIQLNKLGVGRRRPCHVEILLSRIVEPDVGIPAFGRTLAQLDR